MALSMTSIATSDITAVVLAGGRGTRMGGVDKGLQPYRGLPLAQHAARRIASQVGQVLINANRHLEVYQSFGYPVYSDAQSDYAGPLAGFAVALAACTTPYLLTVPCDSPLFPPDLAKRMAQGLQGAGDAPFYEIAVAARGGYSQPVFCLIKRELLTSLEQFMASGQRKIDQWTARHRTVMVSFDRVGDSPLAFANANTVDELSQLQSVNPS